MTSSVYDTIGQEYLRYRRPDPRIIQSIVDLLAVPRGSVIADIGAGYYSRALFQANLKYPEEIDMPLHRLVREKLSG